MKVNIKSFLISITLILNIIILVILINMNMNLSNNSYKYDFIVLENKMGQNIVYIFNNEDGSIRSKEMTIGGLYNLPQTPFR